MANMQIWKDADLTELKLQKYIFSSREMVSLDISGFTSEPSNGGENVFLWHLMEVFPHCSIFKGLLYAMSIFNGSAAGPLFVRRQKDIGWVVKVSIIKISYSRNISITAITVKLVIRHIIGQNIVKILQTYCEDVENIKWSFNVVN